MDPTRFFPLYDMPGHLIRRAAQCAGDAFEQELGEFGITPSQLSILFVVHLQEGLEQREIAKIASYDAPTVGGVLMRLERAGLIARERSDRSKRGWLVYLTDKGRRMTTSMGPAIARIQRRLLAPLTLDERRTLLELLSKMASVENSFFARPSRAARTRPRRP